MKKTLKLLFASMLIYITFVAFPVTASAKTTELSKYLNYTGKQFASKFKLKRAPVYEFTSENFGIYYTITGHAQSNTLEIVDGCLNKKGNFSISIHDNAWSIYGVKYGMTKSQVKKKLASRVTSITTNSSGNQTYTGSKFRMFLYYTNNKVSFITYQSVSYQKSLADYWAKRNAA